MRQSLARFSASVSSFHAPSWADFITTTLAFRFSVHTPRMTELRSLIEAKALEWAIPKMSKADLEKATRILAELDKAKSTDRIIALNARFHEALYAPARKDRTLAIVAKFADEFRTLFAFHMAGDAPPRPAAERAQTDSGPLRRSRRRTSMHVAEAAHSGNGKSLGGTLAITSAWMMHDARDKRWARVRFTLQ